MPATSTSNRWDRYFTPKTVEEALGILREYDGEARVIGGGTDLFVEAPGRLQHPLQAVVDVTRIEGLDSITEDGDNIEIGCGATHSQIAGSPLITEHGACLAESCGSIGGPQVRNVGTLSGNIAHALPAGDGTIGLLALGGEIEVAGAAGTNWMPLEDSFTGPGQSVIDHHRQILTRMRFPRTGRREGSAYKRVMRPQGLTLPIIAMGARVSLDTHEDLVSAARISLGPVAPVPYLAAAAAEVLVGHAATRERFAMAAEVILEHVSVRASKYRSSSAYREQMVRSFVPVILERSVERAGGSAS